LVEVTAGQDENFDSLLKRFNRKVQQDGILAELRRREHYEKPSVRRKRKKAAKKRGSARTSRMFRRTSSR
jgi:small subunit ribosomal protein S21